MGSDESTVLYTIGYEGRTVPTLIKALSEAGVERLIDVRMRPSSRQRGFSLMQLYERLRRAGIQYEHVRELGNPPEIRALWYAGEIGEGRRRYRAHLKNGSSDHVAYLVGLAKLSPTAILCRERDHDECHRSVVAEVAAERDEGIGIIHL